MERNIEARLVQYVCRKFYALALLFMQQWAAKYSSENCK